MTPVFSSTRISVRVFFEKNLREALSEAYRIEIPSTVQSTRDIGGILRTVIEMVWQGVEVVELDFQNEPVASGSIFDELAKLFDTHPKEEVKRRLKFVNIDVWDQNLFLHLAKMRLEDLKKALQPA